MHPHPDTLSAIIHEAHQKSGLTMEKLAERIGISERYLYRIENEGKKPSYEVLYRLVRELSLSPQAIFFPEKERSETEMDSLVRLLCQCDSDSLQVVRATTQALLNVKRTSIQNCTELRNE